MALGDWKDRIRKAFTPPKDQPLHAEGEVDPKTGRLILDPKPDDIPEDIMRKAARETERDKPPSEQRWVIHDPSDTHAAAAAASKPKGPPGQGL